MYDLSGNGIYQARKTVEAFLAGDRIDHRQAVRLCMTLEEALLNCQEHCGESTPFTLKTKKLLGRIQIVIQIAGESFDPFNNALDDDLNLLRKLNADAANTCAWSYRNGVNTVSLVPRKERKFSSSVKTLLAIVLAVCLGLACAKLPDAIRVPLLESFVAPTLNTIMGVISAVAGPMIFFSLVWGVCTISDVSTLSRIGKRMLGRFMLELFVLSALATLLCYPFFRAASGGSASFQADEF